MKNYFKYTLLLLVCSAYIQAHGQLYKKEGLATYYANFFEGRLTANGQVFRQKQLTAAHQTLPLGTYVKVTNLNNNKSVVVLINDRGGFKEPRIIDLSRAAADSLGFTKKGVQKVLVEQLPINWQTDTIEILVEIPKDTLTMYTMQVNKVTQVWATSTTETYTYITPQAMVVVIPSSGNLTKILPLLAQAPNDMGMYLSIRSSHQVLPFVWQVEINGFKDANEAMLFLAYASQSFPKAHLKYSFE